MCGFRDLSKSSVKDNYPFPNMEFLLQQVMGSACMSMLDDFFGYNQFLVVEEDRETTFITPWETYAYAWMPFGLKNAVATFQRDMDHAFEGLIQVDIGGHPPFPTGSKQFSDNLLFLAVFNFRGQFEGPNEGFLRSRFSIMAKGMIDPPK